jgi:molybdopterin-containing oxidoreductase family membrane subunit
MTADRRVFGVFANEAGAVATIEAMRGGRWRLERVHSPFPSHRIMAALNLKKSRVGYFTLAGGILGFLSGIGLAIYTAMRWHLIVWGKPVVAWIPFFIVGFEFTILFSVFGNVLGLLVLGDLPDFRGLKHYDPRCSGEHFGILAACPEGEQEGLADFFRSKGGEPRLFE